MILYMAKNILVILSTADLSHLPALSRLVRRVQRIECVGMEDMSLVRVRLAVNLPPLTDALKTKNGNTCKADYPENDKQTNQNAGI
ncbi:hypothetical protein F2P81_018823 [Scophthalmus maximus]|uniref:Uncharacterized protein n=1 Tax=Scophthalmus maximus TaxID=52904 RepID=A0A6A4SBP0_SCOMX|nr:hypothetical protein F2P81_018823 [Scophthalmus maximus]